MGRMDTSTGLPHLTETIVATARYLGALTVLNDDDVRAPSLLPDWTRGHVITHLARNADGLTNLLHSAQTGEPIPMYASQEQRNADIEAGAPRSAADLIEDSVAAAGRWLQAANELHASNLDREVFRTLGSPPWPAYRVGVLRRTEVEVHHADLNIGYTAHDWPEDFTAHLLHRRERELAAEGTTLTLRLTDTGSTINVGEGGTEVSGHSADVAWWVIGRGEGDGLVSSTGKLPELGAWA